MGDVVGIPVAHRGKISADWILAKAAEAKMTELVVVGWDENGDLYFAGTETYGPDILVLLDLAKKRLLDTMDVRTRECPSD